MGVGEGERVVEDVALEEDAEPAIERELPELHVAIVALRHEGIEQHHEERADRATKMMSERRRRQQPAATDVPCGRARLRDLGRRRHGQSLRTWAASACSRMPTRSPASNRSAPARLFCRRTMKRLAVGQPHVELGVGAGIDHGLQRAGESSRRRP